MDRAGPIVRRWARVARVDGVVATLGAAYLVARLVASLGRPIAFYPDSPSYFEFRLWGGVRFPVVTAFYALVGNHRTIATLQAGFGAICWPVAAVIAGSVLASRWWRYAFVALTLVVGCTLPVTTFDNVLLSESVAISLSVLFVAVVFRFACVPTRASALSVFVVGVVWGMSRQNNAAMLAVVALLLALLAVFRSARALAWRIAAGFAVVSVVGLLMAGSTSQIQEYNTAQILVRRVIQDDARSRWFVDHGMPDSGVAVVTRGFATGIGDGAIALQNDPVFGSWLARSGPTTYLRYLATHPGFVVTTPFGDDGALYALGTGVTVYGRSTRVLPGSVESITWPTRGSHQRLALAGVILLLVAAGVTSVWSRSRRRAAVVALAVLVVGAANVVFVTHSAGLEYERLLVPTGVALRVALLWLLAAVAGGVDVVDA